MPKPLKMVEVVWSDSTGGSSDWHSEQGLKDFAKGGCIRIRTVGLLRLATPKHLLVLQSVHDSQSMYPLLIPRGCVIEVNELRRKKARSRKAKKGTN